jgi:hypothetical protein
VNRPEPAELRHVEEILLRYDAYEFGADDAIAELRKVMPRCTEDGAWSLLRPRGLRGACGRTHFHPPHTFGEYDDEKCGGFREKGAA